MRVIWEMMILCDWPRARDEREEGTRGGDGARELQINVFFFFLHCFCMTRNHARFKEPSTFYISLMGCASHEIDGMQRQLQNMGTLERNQGFE